MGYKVAVVGATGNVGREMLGILAERSFPRITELLRLPAFEYAPQQPFRVAAGAAVSGLWSGVIC
jgi:uncharacterized protein YbjT (DUF2867 family)